MKSKILFLCLFICLDFFGIDNRHRVLDSLLKLLPQTKGEQQADVLNALADMYFDKLEEPEKSKPYADRALESSKKLNYKKGLAQSYLILARLKDHDEKYDEACQLYFNSLMSLNMAKKNIFGKYDQIIFPTDDPDMGEILGNINFHFGNTLRQKLNLSKSVERLLEALRCYEGAYEIVISEYIKNMNEHGVTVKVSGLTIPDALDYLRKHPEDKKAFVLSKKAGDKLTGIRFTCLRLGDGFSLINDDKQAIFYLKKALKIAEDVEAQLSYLKILNSVGNYYLKIKEYDSSIVYGTKLRMNAEKQKEVVFIAVGDQILGKAYSEKGEFMKALEYHKHIDNLLEPLRNGTYKGNELYEWVSDDDDAKSISLTQSAFNYILIGDIYSKSGEHSNEAKLNYLMAIKTFEIAAESDAIPGVSKNNYSAWLNKNLGETYSKAGMFEKGIGLLEKVIPFVETNLDKEEELSFYKSLYESYDKINDPKKSYIYYKKYVNLKDSLFGQQNSNEIAQIQKRFEVEKKDADIDLLNKAQEAQASELEKQKLVRNGFIGGFFVLTILAFVIFRSLQQNKKAKKTIEHQKELVEEKNKEITDSITYAKRLQDAILPPEKFVKENLPGTFILYKPKDIVAGDFYWAEKIKDNFYIAAADCTGHGVPGAMVSVVCSNALNRAVKEFNLAETGKILDKVRELVIETFEKSDKDVKDGMDISLLCVNSKTNYIQWSGANNPLWYIENDELKEITANKQPIGKFDNEKPFTTHALKLKSNSSLFLFTDGYADQFGGPKGKKFKYKQLGEILIQNVSKTPQEQSDILNIKFEKWKENVEQVDDVCIIGIKL